MNFVGDDGESELWKSFWIFVYVQTAEGTASDSLVCFFMENFVEKNLW